MLRPTPLVKAERLIRAHKYSKCISLLEPLVLEYRDTFRFYYLLGVAYLYVGDLGSAEAYFSRARRFTTTNTDLLLAQGALFLRRGERDKAVSYFLDVKDANPGNRAAQKAIDFLRHNYEGDAIQKFIETGKIKRFYPKFGPHPAIFPAILGCVAAVVLGFAVYANYGRIVGLNGTRADLSMLELSVDERRGAIETDLSGGVYRYLLSSSEVTAAYGKAQRLFQQNRDNAAQVEINRLLNSNASNAVKFKAQRLMDYLDEPTFSSLGERDRFSYREVAKDPLLYRDCWVIWQGFVTNDASGKDVFSCDLLVGDENFKNMEDFVAVTIPQPVQVERGRFVQILGRIDIQDGKIVLRGKTVFQPVKPRE